MSTSGMNAFPGFRIRATTPSLGLLPRLLFIYVMLSMPCRSTQLVRRCLGSASMHVQDVCLLGQNEIGIKCTKVAWLLICAQGRLIGRDSLEITTAPRRIVSVLHLANSVHIVRSRVRLYPLLNEEFT